MGGAHRAAVYRFGGGGGASGWAVALGSELVRLTQAERLELTEKLPRMVDGRVSILISVGAESARDAAHYAEEAEKHAKRFRKMKWGGKIRRKKGG